MSYLLGAILIMALVTYLPRVLPLTVFRGQLRSTFLRTFLEYVPYAVLGAMTFPSIFYATDKPISAIFGTICAVAAAYWGGSLLIVALIAVAAACLGTLLC